MLRLENLLNIRRNIDCFSLFVFNNLPISCLPGQGKYKNLFHSPFSNYFCKGNSLANLGTTSSLGCLSKNLPLYREYFLMPNIVLHIV